MTESIGGKQLLSINAIYMANTGQEQANTDDSTSYMITHDAIIVYHQAVTQDISDKQDTKNLYDTPIYKTRQRGVDP